MQMDATDLTAELPKAAMDAGIKAQAQGQNLQGQRVLILEDPSTGVRTESVFDSSGRLIQMISSHSKQKLKRVFTFSPSTRETGETVYRAGKRVNACTRKKVDTQLVTRCGAQSAVSEEDEPQAIECQRPPVSREIQAKVETLWGSVDTLLELRPQTVKQNRFGQWETPLGHNLVADRTCDAYAKRNPDLSEPGRHDGPQGLADDLNKSIKDGLRCMLDRSPTSSTQIGGSPAVREAALRLSALLIPGYSRPVRVLCAADAGESLPSYGGTYTFRPHTVASAHVDCTHDTFPTLALNLKRSQTQGFRGYASVFHELLHAAGYPHDTGVDIPYLVSACCLEGPSSACGILRRNKPFTSKEYQTDFSDFMVRERRQIPEAAFAPMNAILQDRANPEAGAAGAARTLTNLLSLGKSTEALRKEGWPAYLFMVGRFGDGTPGFRNSLSETMRKFYPLGNGDRLSEASKRYFLFADFSDALRRARTLSASSRKSRDEFGKSLSSLREQLETLCSSLEEKEKWALGRFGSDAIGLTTPEQLDVLEDSGIEWKKPCS